MNQYQLWGSFDAPHAQSLSQQALAWLKVCYHAEDLECLMRKINFHFLFLMWLCVGDCWVLISESLRRELSEGFFGVYWSRSGTLIYEKTFWFGWPAGVEDCGLESPWSKQTLGYVRKNLVWLGDFKFSLGNRTRAYRAPVLMAFLRYIVRTDVGESESGGEAGSFLLIC
jgi:hypothetical protein